MSGKFFQIKGEKKGAPSGGLQAPILAVLVPFGVEKKTDFAFGASISKSVRWNQNLWLWSQIRGARSQMRSQTRILK